jgi:hypothetical protein
MYVLSFLSLFCFVYREELQMERLELLLEVEEGTNRSLPVNYKKKKKTIRLAREKLLFVHDSLSRFA